MNELKVFTLDEANQLLPILNSHLFELHKKRDLVADLEVLIDAQELIVVPEKESAGQELSRLIDQHREVVSQFYEVVDDIHKMGCFLKDLDLGLIDFYGMIQGKVVYFCWRLGENKISYWHEIGQGFTHRQPLT